MRFEWDDEKNAANIRKHKIDFADVPPVFSGPMLMELDERIDYGENRWLGIGLLKRSVVLVVFVERDGDTLHLISARKANQHEREKYEQAIAN